MEGDVLRVEGFPSSVGKEAFAMRRIFFFWARIFAVLLSFGAAWGDFYVIPVGKKFKRTVVVSPVGTVTKNGTTLLNALASITDASPTNPYMLKIEPGSDTANEATNHLLSTREGIGCQAPDLPGMPQ
jgi:hypothetical protein